MESFNLTTKEAKPKKIVIDATGLVFGRLSSRIASILMGKHTARFQPGWNGGDKVLVINAEKVKVTGNKLQTKIYRKHTNFPGGLKETVMQKMMERKPEHAIANAVKGMLPHNARGRKLYKNLRVVSGPGTGHSGLVGAETLQVKL
jgi:large subunit ribosomal protein L13